MGRELKKVPLDFKWPQGQIWKGYINPFTSQKCNACDGIGYNPETSKINDDWYSFEKEDWVYPDGINGRRWNNAAWSNHITQVEVDALIANKRLYDFTHEFIKGQGWVKKNPEYIPTAEEVNEWNRRGMGHDGINRMICVEARAKHLGVYGYCDFCDGEGRIWQSEEIKKMHDEWEDFDPPTGEGFQLWSTTSEGNPMTPVFATLEELCQHCEDEKVSIFGFQTATKEEWMDFLSKEFPVLIRGNVMLL